MLYFIIDDLDSFCGITDRLKTAVGLYWVALQNGVGFKFIHTAGFDIRDYLVPNKVQWSAELSDIPKLPWKKKKLDYIPPFNGVPSLKKNKTYYVRVRAYNSGKDKKKVYGKWSLVKKVKVKK